MSGLLERFSRTRRGRPCPICGHEGWCLAEYDSAGNPLRAICKRVPSGKQWGQAGYLHVLRDDRADGPTGPYTAALHSIATPVHLARRMEDAHRRLVWSTVAIHVASELGISIEALIALGAGIEHRSLLFPMFDHQRRLVGIRTRARDGAKRAIKGSRNGLFIPLALRLTDVLYVCEGPTDTAAVIGLGLSAIGRASAATCVLQAVRFVRARPWPMVAVIRDNDAIGTASADELGVALRVVARDVRIVSPDRAFKDVRDWVRSGADTAVLQAAVEVSVPIGLDVRGGRR